MKEAQLVARWLHDLSGYTAEAPSMEVAGSRNRKAWLPPTAPPC